MLAYAGEPSVSMCTPPSPPKAHAPQPPRESLAMLGSPSCSLWELGLAQPPQSCNRLKHHRAGGEEKALPAPQGGSLPSSTAQSPGDVKGVKHPGLSGSRAANGAGHRLRLGKCRGKPGGHLPGRQGPLPPPPPTQCLWMAQDMFSLGSLQTPSYMGFTAGSFGWVFMNPPPHGAVCRGAKLPGQHLVKTRASMPEPRGAGKSSGSSSGFSPVCLIPSLM